MRLALSSSLAAFAGLVLSISSANAQTAGKADCLMENCLPSQSGYLDGYNFDPAVVGSPTFGQLWTVRPGRAGEVFLAQPLTYTPPGGTQSVIAASEDNKVYVLDALTGATRAQMTTVAPYLAPDTSCTDIVPNIGITGTPVISPDLNTLYFWSKGYIDPAGKTTGLANGRYRFYGVDPVTLAVKFVTDPQGIQPSNRPGQYFEGGKQLQRTGLTLLNGVVYAGFGGHCDNFNYTGWVIGMDAKTGAVVTSFTTESGIFGTTGAGIWQAGAALPSDGKNLWLVTGNGYGEELSTAPRIGRNPPGALPMSVVKLGFTNGSLTPVDFFTPSDFRALDAADQDFGSSGVCFLPTGFSTGSVGRLAIANGKNSKAYIMNADNLGGYKTGAGGGDGNLQTIPLNGPSFSTAGGYPLEGGYIYISSTASPTIAFKLTSDSNGNPNFVQVGQTADSSTNGRGIGHTTTTSYMGQPGSGLLWVTDLTNGNIRVYPAVPPANGNMSAIFIGTLPNGGVKYQRVVPGNGRMYIVGTSGYVSGFGSPVNQPLNCTTPLAFGTVVQGQNMTLPVTCKANINTQISNVTVSDPSIKISNFPANGTSYTATSASFAFNVTWSPTKLALFTGSVNIGLTNGKAGYVTNLPIVIRGNVVAAAPSFQLTPNNVAFGGLVPGSTETVGGLNKSIQLSNLGLGNLNIIGWDFDEVWGTNLDTSSDDDDGPDFDLDGTMDNNTSTGNFTLYDMPSTIATQSSVGLTLNFNPNINGDWKANLTIYTNGGTASTLLTGSADGPPVMTYSTQQYNGRVLQGVPYMDFGNILAGNASTLVLSVSNQGESALTITKSKPPNDPVIHALNPATDLTEGQVVGPNSTATGGVQLQSPVSQVNVPAYNVSSQWVLNGNDPTFGVQFVAISGRIVSRQVGPLLNVSDPWDKSGTARYGYLGCFKDYGAGNRTLATQLTVTNNDNAACINAAMKTGPANFVGTEYAKECYTAPMPPKSAKVTDLFCEMTCPNDPTQVCGDSGYLSVFYDKLAYNATSGTFLPGAYTGPANLANVTAPNGKVYNYVGCAADNSNPRPLTGYSYTDSKNMTVENCVATCSSKGFAWAGLEYAQECYCGASIPAGTNTSVSGCTSVCKGSINEYCGAGSRLSLYALSGTSVPVTTTTSTTTSSTTTTPAPTTTSTTTTTSTSTSTSTSTTPFATPTSSGIVSAVGSSAYQGCWSDDPNLRTLKVLNQSAATTTVEGCVQSCTNSGYSIAGVENGSDCWCGNGLSPGAAKVSDSQCSTPCGGNSYELCGGSSSLVTYSATAIAPATQPTKVSNTTFQGCFPDTVNARTLQGAAPALGSANSLENCAAACSAYSYFGTEYGAECYCGNALLNGATAGDASQCNMLCSGNGTEVCGAANRLSVYLNPNPTSTQGGGGSTPTALQPTTISGNWTLQGCYNDTVGARTLQGKAPTLSSSNSLEACAAACSGFTYFGTEYGKECFCGNAILNGAVPQPASQCSTPCAANSTEICGAANRLSLYQLITSPSSSTSSSSATSTSTTSTVSSTTTSSSTTTATPTSSSTTSSTVTSTSTTTSTTISTSTSTTSTSSSTTSTSTTTSTATSTSTSTTSTTTSTSTSSTTSPSATQTLTGLKPLGCYLDASGGRSLSVTAYSNTSNSVDNCALFCRNKRYRYSGTSAGKSCYCGNFLQNSAASAGPGQTGCTTACPANSTQTCGGTNRINIVQDLNWQQSVFTVDKSGQWTFMDCYTDSSSSRTLNVTLNIINITVDKCLTTCLGKKLNYCGMSSGSSCFGAQVLNPNATAAVSIGSKDPQARGCSATCTGNTTQACGGSSKLDVYYFNSTAPSVSPATVQIIS